MKWKVSLLLFLILTSMLVPIYVVKSQSSNNTSETQSEVVEIKPHQKVFTYETEDFQLNVTVPRYISLSTPDSKIPARLDIYLKMLRSLSGFFSVDVEGGIMVRLPTLETSLFIDIDMRILGKWMPDCFRFEYPISGILLEAMSFKGGDVGVYALVVPLSEGEVELESLTLNERHHIGSYNIYVVEEPQLVTLGIPTENITIGEVKSLETRSGSLEEIRVELAEISHLIGHYSYEDNDNLVSINITSSEQELYPGETLTLNVRIETKTDIYFNYFTINVYGVKRVEDEYVSDLIRSLEILSDTRLSSGL